MLETLIFFFTSESMIAFVKKFTTEYMSEKATDKILSFAKSKFTDNSFEYQLISLLDETLESTCSHFGWEYDMNAMTETFILEWQNLNSVTSEDGLKSILYCAIGNDSSEKVYRYWIECFSKNVSNPKYQWVYNYINNNIGHKSDENHTSNIIFTDSIVLYHNKYQEPLFLHKHLDETQQISLKDIFVFPSCFIMDPQTHKPKSDALEIQEVIKFYFHQRPKNSSEPFYEIMFLEGLPALGKSSLVSCLAWNNINGTDLARELLGTRKLIIVRLRDILSENTNFIDIENPMHIFFSHLCSNQLDGNLLTQRYKYEAPIFFKNSALILDGFDELCMIDEVLYDHGTAFFMNIYRQLQKWNCNCKIIITTRPNYIKIDKLNFPFIYLDILPFDFTKRIKWLEQYTKKEQVKSELRVLIKQEQSEQMEFLLQIPLVLYMITAKNIIIGNSENLWYLYYVIFHEEVYERNYENLDSHATALYKSDLYILTSEIAYTLCKYKNTFFSVDKLLKKENIKEIIGRMNNDNFSVDRLKVILENCVGLTSYFSIKNRQINEHLDKHIIEFCHNNIRDFFYCESLWEKLNQIYENIPEEQKDWELYFIRCLQKIFQDAPLDMKGIVTDNSIMAISFFSKKVIYYKENGLNSFVTKEIQNKYFQHFFGKMLYTGMIFSYQYEEDNNVINLIANMYASVLTVYRAIYFPYLKKGERLILADEEQDRRLAFFTFHLLFCFPKMCDHTYLEFERFILPLIKFPAWDFSYSRFRNCMLRFSDFGKSNLQGVDFTGSNLGYCNFRYAIINDETCFANCCCDKARVTKEQVKYFEKYGITDLEIYD